MELNEIITLINAGYTKEEIEAMSKPEATEGETKTETEAKTEVKEDADPDNDVIAYLKSLEKKLNGVVDTVEKIQTDNINTANAGEPDPTPDISELVLNFTKDM